MLAWQWTMNCKGYGTIQLWLNLQHHTGLCSYRLRKTKNISNRTVSVLAKAWTQHLKITCQRCYILSQCVQIQIQTRGAALEPLTVPTIYPSHMLMKDKRIQTSRPVNTTLIHISLICLIKRNEITSWNLIHILPTTHKLLSQIYQSSSSAIPHYFENVPSKIAAPSVTHHGVIQSQLFPYLQFLLCYLLLKHLTKVYWKGKKSKKQIQ
jgi:hypothetical protein